MEGHELDNDLTLVFAGLHDRLGQLFLLFGSKFTCRHAAGQVRSSIAPIAIDIDASLHRACAPRILAPDESL